MDHPVAIIGGGFLGGAVAQALREPAVVVTRSGSTGVALDIVAAAATEIRDVLAPANAIVFAVAPGRTQDRRALYVEGTRRVLDATSGWRRIVYVGSTSALPDRDAWLDESADAAPATERGAVQREAEAVVRRYGEAHDAPWLALRLGGLYGPTRPIGRIYSATRRHGGNAPRPGDGHVPTNLIHQHDAVQAVLAALDADPGMRGIVHVCDDDHTTRREMYGPHAQWEAQPRPGAPARGKRVSNLKLKTALGVQLRHPTHSPVLQPLPSKTP